MHIIYIIKYKLKQCFRIENIFNYAVFTYQKDQTHGEILIKGYKASVMRHEVVLEI